MSGQFLDKQSILFVESEIKNGRFGKLNSFFLFKDAKKIVESYYNGYNAHTLHEFQSVTKSLQSLLIGIAIDKGLITSLDTPIQIYFEDVKGVDWRNGKGKISIKDLLQMTAGLAWNESDTSYLSLNNHSNQLAWSNNWLEFALNRPMGYDSGKKFCYSSANPILLSAIVNKVYEPGQEKFIRQYLFKPLEISLFHYHRSLNDSNILADIDMLPKDMAKIALLVAQNGNWEGQQDMVMVGGTILYLFLINIITFVMRGGMAANIYL